MRDKSTDVNVEKVKKQFAEKQIDRREFLRYSTALGLSVAGAYAFMGSVTGERFARTALAQNLPKGGVLRIAMQVPEVKSPHTYVQLWDALIAMQTVEFLTKVSPDGATQPSLLEKWTTSPDLKTWTFNVHKGIKWHKGRDFTSDDVIWNIKRSLDPATGSSTLGLMKGYMMDDAAKNLWDSKAIERVDAHTFRMNLKAPTIALPIHMFHYAFLMLDPDEKGIYGVGSNGTGAFELVQHDVARKAVVKARKSYWGTGPFLDSIEFIDLGSEPAAQISALASKQVDGLAEASIQQLDALKAMPHLKLYQAQTALTPIAGMKVTKKPFDDPRVRMAMRKGIDSAKVVNVVTRNLGIEGEHHHVFPKHPEYFKLPAFKRDVAGAKKLLADAGHPNGFEIEMAVPQTPWYCPLAAQAMVEQWKDIGVRVKINPIPEVQFWDSAWPNATFNMPYWLHRSIGTMVLSLGYRGGSSWNVFEWANKEFDNLITEAEGQIDVEKRRAIMAKIEKIVQEDGPVIQPVWVPLVTFYDKRVKGFVMQPAKYLYGNELALDKA
jgi:peptide/nickel transport system substrate-binding protein